MYVLINMLSKAPLIRLTSASDLLMAPIYVELAQRISFISFEQIKSRIALLYITIKSDSCHYVQRPTKHASWYINSDCSLFQHQKRRIMLHIATRYNVCPTRVRPLSMCIQNKPNMSAVEQTLSTERKLLHFHWYAFHPIYPENLCDDLQCTSRPSAPIIPK